MNQKQNEKPVQVQVLPYMGPPKKTEAEIKRKNKKSPVAVGTGCKVTSSRIPPEYLE